MTDDKKTDVWMPIWIGSYMADTMDLTTQQHGAYLLLLLNYWRKRCALPDNDETLRSITKMERAEWKRHRPVLAAFFRVGGGVWLHKRVEAEMIKADKRAADASAKASKGAQARWWKSPKECPDDTTSMPQALLDDMPKQCPTPSPISPSENIEPNGSRRQADQTLPNCPHDQIVSLYHQQLPELPSVRLQSEARQKAMRSFWRWVLTSKKSDGQARANGADQALTWISAYFERARGNDFLMGRTQRSGAHAGWVCDFDFLLTEKGRKQVIEKTVDTV